MTYYEEFGIPSSATPEEIRHAHRRLIKILHPDVQNAAESRQIAEIQARRINGIAEILLDPDQRTAYDASLLPPAGAAPRWRYPILTPGSVVSAVLALGGLLMLSIDRQLTPSAPNQSAQAQPMSSLEPNLAPKELESKHVSPVGSVNRQGHPIGGVREQALYAPPPIHIESTKLDAERSDSPRLPSPPTQVSDQKATSGYSGSPPHSEDQNPLIGTWIYVPTPLTEEDRKLYRPEYIEMRIREVRGFLEGNYRARYHVPDRPLSPNVGFRFAGQPGAAPGAFRWSGSNGIAGRVELRLMTANSMQVDWQVTELPEAADLVSGTAILTRVQ